MDTLARLDPSPARRMFGVAVLCVVGAMVLWLGLVEPVAPWARVALPLMGAGVLWSAHALWRATQVGLVLTDAGIFDGHGRCLVPMAEIRAVDRGAFALKPSNGFVVRLRSRARFGYAPGLWWRLGRRLGVGGVTEAVGARAMADRLALLLAERDGY